MDLQKLVRDQISELGIKDASSRFGVSAGTISNWSSGKTSPSLEAAQIALVHRNLSDEEVDEEDGFSYGGKDVPVKLENWEGKNVIILLPVYRSFNADTHFTLFANYAKYGPDKIGMIQEKRTVIHESRNILAHKFLKTNAENAIMCDDDMILPCGSQDLFNGRYGANVSPKSASFNAISRIMEHSNEVGIVGGLYFGRHAQGVAQCSSGFASSIENERLHSMTYTGLKKEEWVGTGFMRIKRWVFERMAEEIKNGRWPECKPIQDNLWLGFFNPIRVGIGEDVSFCRRALEIGIQSYLDTELILLHNGECNFGWHNTKKR